MPGMRKIERKRGAPAPAGTPPPGTAFDPAHPQADDEHESTM
jgi:hypothetical protein